MHVWKCDEVSALGNWSVDHRRWWTTVRAQRTEWLRKCGGKISFFVRDDGTSTAYINDVGHRNMWRVEEVWERKIKKNVTEEWGRAGGILGWHSARWMAIIDYSYICIHYTRERIITEFRRTKSSNSRFLLPYSDLNETEHSLAAVFRNPKRCFVFCNEKRSSTRSVGRQTDGRSEETTSDGIDFVFLLLSRPSDGRRVCVWFMQAR